MKKIISSVLFAFLFSISSYAAARVYLGVFDFDYECKDAAHKAGYKNFEFSPLDGSCYGIK